MEKEASKFSGFFDVVKMKTRLLLLHLCKDCCIVVKLEKKKLKKELDEMHYGASIYSQKEKV